MHRAVCQGLEDDWFLSGQKASQTRRPRRPRRAGRASRESASSSWGTGDEEPLDYAWMFSSLDTTYTPSIHWHANNAPAEARDSDRVGWLRTPGATERETSTPPPLKAGATLRIHYQQIMDLAYAFAYCSALITSMPTNGSSPSTQASCPGGIVYDSPAEIVCSDPSVRRTTMRPETAYPA